MKTRIYCGLLAAGFFVLLQGCTSPGKNEDKPVVGGSAATQEIEKYRAMLADGNPSDLYEAAGEDIWKKPMGPKNVSLEKCDLGMGPGVVKGAYTQLPKYFKDTNKVQDLESRLITCMSKMQGYDANEIIKAGFGKGKRKDIEAVVAYVVAESKGMPINVVVKHPKEKQAFEMGKQSFFYQGGPMDFSCASCHGSDGKRIRLQDLPNITTQKGAAAGWGSWPAYRVSSGTFWTMQQRLNDCYRQQRFPEPIYTSEDTIAVSMYMAVTAKGGTMTAPGLKR
ncbi:MULTISPECIES: sulfur oxidation c-type cytochrome SoxA [unclassified Polynucleobacter]|uniref:sulfur oxidation c-type cytochrome SoxA n=1 Tax=unclassified Polynucleobacter TaxID=2640945 RepID=UPI001BFDC1C0|nr:MULTISPECIES: sulfur oxidation c-type cytochrome SoxA [unclassified Polynucleobacter]MBU3639064.1 sulfur oxidation c-type cytochrome SoxA [Polynucleobacter sp. AP-RePozz3-80-G7]MEA9601552.1 sulfur oxidation c-type cytochrome SoxA [Polynucleobacter sp. MG-28-Ekke-A2]QWD82402.1 sulfur oxidation c-type cytochrome SoxA [Polynucleobacter sp. MWH-S4W17]